VWQWCRWRVCLSNGKQVTKKWLRKVMQYETKKYENLKKYEETYAALEKLCLDNNFIDFLTLECYDNLNH
jgi:malate synthase